MPTYEYQCDNCGKEFDYFQSMSDSPKTKCEECGGKLTKLLSAGSGLIFKGSGFYITDYKKSGSSEASGSASKSDAPSKSESSGKSEPKSEPKASPTPKKAKE
jgi:putative FmdB family regulatory protein